MVWPVSAITHVSLSWRLLESMIGSLGSGGTLVDTNFTGTPISFWTQRRLNATELSHGSLSPTRKFTAFLSELSFLNCPFDSRCEIEPA